MTSAPSTPTTTPESKRRSWTDAEEHALLKHYVEAKRERKFLRGNKMSRGGWAIVAENVAALGDATKTAEVVQGKFRRMLKAYEMFQLLSENSEVVLDLSGKVVADPDTWRQLLVSNPNNSQAISLLRTNGLKHLELLQEVVREDDTEAPQSESPSKEQPMQSTQQPQPAEPTPVMRQAEPQEVQTRAEQIEDGGDTEDEDLRNKQPVRKPRAKRPRLIQTREPEPIPPAPALDSELQQHLSAFLPMASHYLSMKIHQMAQTERVDQARRAAQLDEKHAMEMESLHLSLAQKRVQLLEANLLARKNLEDAGIPEAAINAAFPLPQMFAPRP